MQEHSIDDSLSPWMFLSLPPLKSIIKKRDTVKNSVQGMLIIMLYSYRMFLIPEVLDFSLPDLTH